VVFLVGRRGRDTGQSFRALRHGDFGDVREARKAKSLRLRRGRLNVAR